MRRARPRRSPFLEIDGRMLMRKSGLTIVVQGARRMKLRSAIGKRVIQAGAAIMGCHIKRFKVIYDR